MAYDSVQTIIAGLSSEEIESHRRNLRRSYSSLCSHYETFSSDPFATAIRMLVKDVLDYRLTAFHSRLTYAIHQNPEHTALVQHMNELTEKLFEENDGFAYMVDSLQFSDWLPHWSTVLEWENTVRRVLLSEVYESEEQQTIKVIQEVLDKRLSVIIALDSLRKDYTPAHRLVQRHLRILFEESSFSSSLETKTRKLFKDLTDNLKPYRNQYFLHPRPALARTYITAVNDRFDLDKLKDYLREDEISSTLDFSFLDRLETTLIDLEVELILQNSN